MSVAFRRESDEEHLEPKFERPLPPGLNLVTARGLALIKAKVAELDGALAEANETEREAIKRDLRYWRTRASSAIIAPDATAQTVAFGTRVTFQIDGVTRTIAIVGSDEAVAFADHVPFTAPLARAMMGAAAGEVVDFNGQAEAIRVVAIAAIDA